MYDFDFKCQLDGFSFLFCFTNKDLNFHVGFSRRCLLILGFLIFFCSDDGITKSIFLGLMWSILADHVQFPSLSFPSQVSKILAEFGLYSIILVGTNKIYTPLPLFLSGTKCRVLRTLTSTVKFMMICYIILTST